MPRSLLASACAAGMLLLPAVGAPAFAQSTAGEIAGQGSVRPAQPAPESAPPGDDGAEAATTLAIVDIQLLLQVSTAAQSIQRQLDEQRAQLQRELAAQEEKVRTSEQELARLRQTLTPEQFDEKRRDFERQVAETRRLIQERTRTLDTAFGSARETLFNTIAQLVQEVAAERGVTMVLPRQGVLVLRDPSLDITDSVLRRLNQRLPQVSVALPAAP